MVKFVNVMSVSSWTLFTAVRSDCVAVLLLLIEIQKKAYRGRDNL